MISTRAIVLALSLSCAREGLTGETSGEQPGSFVLISVECSNIRDDWYIGPMLFEDSLAEGVEFTEYSCANSVPSDCEAKAANS